MNCEASMMEQEISLRSVIKAELWMMNFMAEIFNNADVHHPSDPLFNTGNEKEKCSRKENRQ